MKNMNKKICLLLALALSITCIFSGCGNAKTIGTVKIATKPMAEQYILGEMLGILIAQNTDLKVEITKGIGGGTSNIQPALLNGDFDMYPEYTGTGWNFVLKKEGIPDDDTLLKELKQEYAEQYGLEWVGMYGFNNTFGLAIHEDLAEANNIQTFSDLVAIADTLTFGAGYDFYEREDGFDALCAAYDYHFNKHVDLDIGLKYTSINSKQVDVVNVFTTDGQISTSDITLLIDDKNFYQTYYCGTVVRSDTLEKYPQLRDALMMMDNILTEEEMQSLNYEVEVNNRDEHEVAMEFLQAKELIK